jgi:ketopantoate reductase
MEPLNIAIIGAGSIGQVLAGRLGAGGHTVTLVARPGQVTSLRRDGLRLVQADGAEQRMDVVVTDTLPTANAFDAVFLAVRGDQLAAGLDMLRASRATGGAVVLCGMPVWGPDPRYAVDGFDETWLMLPSFGAELSARGGIEYFFARRPSEIGPMQGPITAGVTRVADALTNAQIPTQAKAELGYRYVALSAVGGPFAVAIAQADFDLRKLSCNRKLRRKSVRAAKECIALAEARTGRALGVGPRLLASLVSPGLALVGPILAQKARSGRVGFILSHRRKIADQDRALLAELHQWGVDHGRESPALAGLLAPAGRAA